MGQLAMRNTWLELLDSVLRPARPHLERSLRARDAHLTSRPGSSEARARAITACVRRIEEARAVVFATNDGVVSSTMTKLEHEWRWLSRPDPEAGLMDLWASLVPPSSVDRKRWRDSPPGAQLDAAVVLASDIEGVESAEAAVESLRVALARHGKRIGARVRWRFVERDSENATSLLDEALRSAREACPARHLPAILDRAHRFERFVREAALERLPERPGLAGDLAHAAFVECVRQASSLGKSSAPILALRTLWKTGYVVIDVQADSVTLGMPALPAE